MDLPPELRRRWGELPYITRRGRYEWSAACPWCGTSDHDSTSGKPDRFRMFAAKPGGPNAGGWCRRCHRYEWADSDRNEPLTKAEIDQLERERVALVKRERIRIERRMRQIEEAAYWRGWYDALSRDRRELWHKEGIVDYYIDRYMLGFCPEYSYTCDGSTHQSPSLTIPYWHGNRVINIQHRLLDPVDPRDKYRQLAGIPPAIFRTEPDDELSGPVLVVEGAKKAIVMHMVAGHLYKVVGVPSKHPTADMVEELSLADPVIIGLDPDASAKPLTGGSSSMERFAKMLGQDRTLAISWPIKPDDMVVHYNTPYETMLEYVKNARRIA